MAITNSTTAFANYLQVKYKGKVYKMERLYRPDHIGLEVHVMFRMPEDIDEIEMFKRINSVIAVIAEGTDG